MKALKTRLERLEAGRAKQMHGPVVFMRPPDGPMRVMGTNGFRARQTSESLEDFQRAAESAGRRVMVIRLVAGRPA